MPESSLAMKTLLIIVLLFSVVGCSSHMKIRRDPNGQIESVIVNKSGKYTYSENGESVTIDTKFGWPFESGLINLGLNSIKK